MLSHMQSDYRQIDIRRLQDKVLVNVTDIRMSKQAKERQTEGTHSLRIGVQQSPKP